MPKQPENKHDEMRAATERMLVKGYRGAVIRAAGGDVTFQQALKVIDADVFERLRASYATQIAALGADPDLVLKP